MYQIKPHQRNATKQPGQNSQSQTSPGRQVAISNAPKWPRTHQCHHFSFKDKAPHRTITLVFPPPLFKRKAVKDVSSSYIAQGQPIRKANSFFSFFPGGGSNRIAKEPPSRGREGKGAENQSVRQTGNARSDEQLATVRADDEMGNLSQRAAKGKLVHRKRAAIWLTCEVCSEDRSDPRAHHKHARGTKGETTTMREPGETHKPKHTSRVGSRCRPAVTLQQCLRSTQGFSTRYVATPSDSHLLPPMLSWYSLLAPFESSSGRRGLEAPFEAPLRSLLQKGNSKTPQTTKIALKPQGPRPKKKQHTNRTRQETFGSTEGEVTARSRDVMTGHNNLKHRSVRSVFFISSHAQQSTTVGKHER